MSDMGINWDLLRTPDMGGAFTAGFERGAQRKREAQVQSALAAYAANPADPASTNALLPIAPEMAFKLQERQRDQTRLDARRAVFAGGSTPPPIAQGSVLSGALAATAQPPPGPGTLVDPSALPPRTDSFRVNPDAMRYLFQVDPDAALDIQKTIYSADAAEAKRLRDSGEILATAAYRLSRMPQGARAAELQAMAPQLQRLGIAPEQLAQTDLSDAGLDRYMTIGRSISDVMKEDDAKYVSVPAGGRLINVRDPEAVRQAAIAPTGGNTPAIASKADYDALPPGSRYIDPTGAPRIKGGAPSQGGATFP